MVPVGATIAVTPTFVTLTVTEPDSVSLVRFWSPDRAVEQRVATLTEAEIEQIVERAVGKVIEKLAGTVLERVAWEVVPDLAEALIKDEIRKIKDTAA